MIGMFYWDFEEKKKLYRFSEKHYKITVSLYYVGSNFLNKNKEFMQFKQSGNIIVENLALQFLIKILCIESQKKKWHAIKNIILKD